MSAVKVTVVLNPTLAEIKAKMIRRQKKLAAFLHLHKEAAIMLDRWVQKNIRSEGGLLNTGAWEPFKIGGRRIKGGGLDTSAKLLQDTGRLRLSMLPFATKRNAGIGSELPYSKHHEEGEGVPMRRLLPVHAEVKHVLRAMFGKHIDSAIRSVK